MILLLNENKNKVQNSFCILHIILKWFISCRYNNLNKAIGIQKKRRRGRRRCEHTSRIYYYRCRLIYFILLSMIKKRRNCEFIEERILVNSHYSIIYSRAYYIVSARDRSHLLPFTSDQNMLLSINIKLAQFNVRPASIEYLQVNH